MSKDAVTAESFARAVSEHTMTVLRDDGLYRHLRFGKPGTVVESFSIVTWPGYLAFVGDMGDYVFKRLDDMTEFFRGHEPNPGYWSSKCVASGQEGLVEFDEAKARLAIEMEVDLWCDAHHEESECLDTRQQVIDRVLSRLDDGEDALRAAMSDFDAPEWIFEDSWEWDFKTFTYHFCWACHAIPWAVAQYDQAKAEEAARPRGCVHCGDAPCTCDLA